MHDRLNPTLAGIDPDWSRLWQEQVNSFFEVRTAAIPIHDLNDETLPRLIGGKDSFGEVWPAAHAVRGLNDAIPPSDRYRFDQRSAGLWQAQLEASARLMEAQRSIRHVPVTSQSAENVNSPPKCSLLGSYEQMGPAGLDDSRHGLVAIRVASSRVARIRLR